MKHIGVYCASSSQVDPAFMRCAEELGRLLAARHLTLVNGAGVSGLMEASARGALAAGGDVIGVIPQFMIDNGWCNPEIRQLIVTDTIHDRKAKIAEMCDATIALPGGCGTLEELLEIITWKQIGLYTKPVCILNLNGYYNPLLDMLRKAIDEHFMREEHAELWTVATSAEEAVQQILRGGVSDEAEAIRLARM